MAWAFKDGYAVAMKANPYSVHKQTVLANRLAFALWANQNQQHDILSALRAEEVNIDDIPGERVPLDLVTEEIQAAARLSKEPQLGMKILDLVDIRITSLYQAMQKALHGLLHENIQLPQVMLFRLIARYFHILSEVVELDVVLNQSQIRLLFHPRNPENYSYHQVEGAVYGLLKLVEVLNNQLPQQVSFAHVPDAIDYDLYRQCLKVTPQFNARQTCLTYQLEAPEDEQQNLPILLNPVVNLHDQNFPDQDYAQRCELLLKTILGFVEPSRESIANILSLSVSTLQRRLRECDTNFNEVLLKVRKQQVEEYLKNTDFNSEQLAFLLGYKAKSQFLKAFRQWYEMTPSEYRKQKKSP